MFLIDVSPSMGKLRTIEMPLGPNGETRTREVTRLQWVLEFVMLKVQEMVNKDTISHLNYATLAKTQSVLRYSTEERPSSVVLFCLALKAGLFNSISPRPQSHLCLCLDTRNIVNETNGGYEHVTEFIPIIQPNAHTMTKIKSIKPSTTIGDRQFETLFVKLTFSLI